MSSYSNTCAICLEDIVTTDTKVITLECKHPFHTPCLSQLRSNKCPTCRRRFTKISEEILAQIFQRENNDILSRNVESFNDLLTNFIRDNDLVYHQTFRRPSFHNVFVETPPAESPVLSLIFIAASLIPLPPPILTILNTPFQGVPLKIILENYIVHLAT